MRLALLLPATALALVAAGCSTRGPEGYQRGVVEASTAAGDADAPVYEAPPSLVYIAALRAAQEYFDGQRIVEDEGRAIAVDDREFWSGNATVDIVVLPQDDQRTGISVTVSGYGMNRPIGHKNVRRRVVNYLARVDTEVRTLMALREAQTPAATGSGTSVTSRP